MGKFRPKRFRYIGGGDQGVNIIFCLLLFSTSFFFRQISFTVVIPFQKTQTKSQNQRHLWEKQETEIILYQDRYLR